MARGKLSCKSIEQKLGSAHFQLAIASPCTGYRLAGRVPVPLSSKVVGANEKLRLCVAPGDAIVTI